MVDYVFPQAQEYDSPVINKLRVKKYERMLHSKKSEFIYDFILRQASVTPNLDGYDVARQAHEAWGKATKELGDTE